VFPGGGGGLNGVPTQEGEHEHSKAELGLATRGKKGAGWRFSPEVASARCWSSG
jgi:hypothetical protein